MARALNESGKPMKGSRILLLGVAYKAGVGDLREAPALKIARLARDLGAEVSYHDSYVPELAELDLRSVDVDEAVGAADLVAIVTAHDGVNYEQVVADAALVLDFRGVTRGIEASNLARL